MRRFHHAVEEWRASDHKRKLLTGPLVRSLGLTLVADGVSQLAGEREKAVTQYGRAAAAYLESRLAERITVDGLAAHLGVSASRTYRLFREQTGMSPIDYLQRLRVKAAEKMLEDTDASISDIALDCGFGSSQYLARCFKRFTGVTPSGYRRGDRRRQGLRDLPTAGSPPPPA